MNIIFKSFVAEYLLALHFVEKNVRVMKGMEKIDCDSMREKLLLFND